MFFRAKPAIKMASSSHLYYYSRQNPLPVNFFHNNFVYFPLVDSISKKVCWQPPFRKPSPRAIIFWHLFFRFLFVLLTQISFLLSLWLLFLLHGYMVIGPAITLLLSLFKIQSIAKMAPRSKTSNFSS